ncbi:MAG: CARDB domain-containing protein [Tepidisphaerales bacterium]
MSRAGPCIAEQLENRVLLAAALDNQIPVSIDPALATQSLFPPGTSQFSPTLTFTNNLGSTFYQFSVVNTAAGQVTNFHIVGTSGNDLALVLFDADGNRLQLADADTPNRWTENLSAALSSRLPYVLGIYDNKNAGASSTASTLTADTGAQRLNSPIAINPATGSTEFLANSGQDMFISPADVNYFPVNLINVGASATVALSQAGSDALLYGQLFEQNGANAPWVSIGSGSGSPVSLTATPPAGGDDTDAQYLLATSTQNFNTAPQAYKVDVTSSTLLGPATVSPTGATALTMLPAAVGQTAASASPLLGGLPQVLYSVTAESTGPMTISLSSSTRSPLVSVYDATGSTLLGVASATSPGSVNVTINATAGAGYLVRVADDHGAIHGQLSLGVSQAYVPTPVSAGSTVGSQQTLSIGLGTGGAFFRVTAASGADYLALQLAPDAGAGTLVPEIAVVGANLAPEVQSGAAGQAVTVPIDMTQASGPVDVYVVGTAGTGTATLSYATLTIPRQIPLEQLPTKRINLKTGGFSSSAASPPFGQLTGSQFFEISPGGDQTLQAQGFGGTVPLVLRYVDRSGVLMLDDRALPASGTTATLAATLQGPVLYAVAAIPLNLTGTGTLQVSVSGASPQGVGVAMVPDPPPPLPPAQPSAPFVSKLRIRGEVLQTAEQRDLFATIVPGDLNNSPSLPQLTFTPNSPGGPLTVRITVLDAQNNPLPSDTFTTQPGQAFTTTLSNLTTAYAGQTIRFEVEPIAGQPLGDGGYSLELDVSTTNPGPYLALEPSLNPGSVPSPVSIPFGGSAVQGDFTSSQPTIQLYSFTLPNGTTQPTTPFQVTTSDLDPTTNTDIKLYIAHYTSASPPAIDQYVELPTSEPSPSFDYYPADRSVIDSRIVVNNYHILDGIFTGAYAPGLNTLYVSVKNEQASTGRYSISAGAVPVTQVGPGNQNNLFGGTAPIIINPEGFTISFFGGGTYPLLAPHNLAGQPTLTVQSPQSSDSLTGSVTDTSGNVVSTFSGSTTTGTITVQLSGIQASGAYTIQINLASNLEANISISAPVNNGPIQPAGDDALTKQSALPYTPSEPYGRALPSPDGSFIDDNSYNLNAGASGTLDKLVFYVANGGPCTFTMSPQNLTGTALALYRGSLVGSLEFSGYEGGLADYSSTADGNGNLSFSDYLTPGMYYLKLTGSVPSNVNFAGDIISGTVPAYDASKIVLDPNTGSDNTSPLQTPDPGATSAISPFFTTFYEVDAPGGVQSDLSVQVQDYVPGPEQEFGQDTVAIWKKTSTGFVRVGGTGLIQFDFNPHTSTITIHSGDTPLPGDQYYIGVNRDRNPQDQLVGPGFAVPQSGNPDLVVDPIVLQSDNGQTRVSITVRNQSFGFAPASHGQLTFSNYPNASVLNLSGIGPFGTTTYTTDWHPTNPSDTVTFTANYDNTFPEINTSNNTQTVALSTVDANIPSVSIALSNPALSGESAPNTWGRWISGVTGAPVDILMTSNDPDGDLYTTTVSGAVYGGFVNSGGGSVSNHVDDISYDLGLFQPTSTANPNQIHYSATDAYGLFSGDQVQSVDVVAKPQFLTGIVFDPAIPGYDLSMQQNVIDYHKTVNQILNANLPVVGDKDNEFLVALSAQGTASMDPTAAVSLPLSARIMIKAVDNTFFDQTFNGSTQPTSQLSVHTTLSVDSHSVDVTAASISVQLQNLSLLNLQTPEIKIFSFGLPGIASIDAGLKFGISAGLSAGAKLGIDPSVPSNPLTAPDRIGVMSPTFIQPSITGSATVEGDVDVLGFNVASLQGTVSLTLQVTAGLDNNDPSEIFSFSNFLNDIAYQINAVLGIQLEADVAIIGKIWGYGFSQSFPLGSTAKEGIITQDPADSGSGAAALLAQLDRFLMSPASIVPAAGSMPAPTVASGSSLLGPYPVSPNPQIVIDPATGTGIAVQVVNVSTTPATTTLANLEYSIRTNGTWSPQTILSGNDANNPVLALTNDSPGNPAAVVVYEGMNTSGSPSGLTLSQRLAATQLRYRYFNGTSWSAGVPITTDSVMNASASVAFNSAGKGLVSWVHNTNPSPMDNNGNYSRSTEDIEAAIWDSTTHTWSAPIAITTPDGVSDSKPASYVGPGGNMYIVWLRDTANGNTLMYSMYNGTSWSAPAVLPITGLPAGGSFGQVAIGRDELGRINVIFSYRTMAADGSVDSRLWNRFSTPANFGQPSGIEEIAQDANYSHLRTTTDQQLGMLVAYWQQGDGANNAVFESTLVRNGDQPAAPWSAPMRLTSTTDLTQSPSVAIESNLTSGLTVFQTLFDQQTPDGGTPAGTSHDPAVGVTLAPGVGSSSYTTLPELSFSNGLHFPYQDAAVVGGTSVGQATIYNSGLAVSNVTINWYSGTPATGTLLGTQQITLSPGNSYVFSQPFPIGAGMQTYSVHVSSAQGEEVTTTDDTSKTTLNGLPDLTIASLTPSDTTPVAGEAITLAADVSNLSGVAVGPFAVTLYSGDPRFPQIPPVAIATQNVTSIAANADSVLNFPLTLPTTAGDYVWTVMADSGGAITEAVESNNDAQYRVSFHADPAIVPVSVGPTVVSMSAKLLNHSGVNNVNVTVPVANLGNIAISNVPVDLLAGRNGGPLASVGTITVPLLAPGQGQVLHFTVAGLAGDNAYFAQIDPSIQALDVNLTNDTAQTSLTVQGLADLTVGSLSLSTPTPQQAYPLTLNAVVSNKGIADASNVLLEVFAVDGSGNSLEVESMRIPLVAALSQVNVGLTIDTTNLLGPYTLLVQVNRLHEVLEKTELNNTATIAAFFAPDAPISNIINGVPGIANTITVQPDADGILDDVWVNIPTTGTPTQLADPSQPIIVNSGGLIDTLVLNASSGTLGPMLTLNGNFSVGSLTIPAGSTVQMAGNQKQAFFATGLTITNGAILDLENNDLVLQYTAASPINTVTRYIHNGVLGTGPRIISSAPAQTFPTAFGIVDNQTIHQTTWDGQTVSNGTNFKQVLTKRTVLGDANLDGMVTQADYQNIIANMGRMGASYFEGDLNGDGVVTVDDLAIVSANLGAAASLAAGPALLAPPASNATAAAMAAGGATPMVHAKKPSLHYQRPKERFDIHGR